MKQRPKLMSLRNGWLGNPVLSGVCRQWLIRDGSLTKRLQQKYADFCVKPLKFGQGRAMLDEANALALPQHQLAMVRCVNLHGKQQAVVYAQSVLPLASLRGEWVGLRQLGNKPLGAILFANRKVKRTKLTYKKLSARNRLYQNAISALGDGAQKQPTHLWARRSIFMLSRAKIMVTEVFLPQLFKDE